MDEPSRLVLASLIYLDDAWQVDLTNNDAETVYVDDQTFPTLADAVAWVERWAKGRRCTVGLTQEVNVWLPAPAATEGED